MSGDCQASAIAQGDLTTATVPYELNDERTIELQPEYRVVGVKPEVRYLSPDQILRTAMVYPSVRYVEVEPTDGFEELS